tara:strand:+ start:278 stop:817 length:540 start_codon:yes stop_codon:yes gene_type:complete
MADVPSYPRPTIAKLLDLTERHVNRLVTDGVLIRDDGKRGRYPITNVTLYIRYLRERAFGQQATETDLHTERTRLARAQADRTEMEVGRLNESLIPAEQVLMDWSDLASNCRAKLLNTPAKIAHLVIAAESYPEAEEIIRNEIHEALNELAQQPFKTNGMESNSKPIQATKEFESIAVG